ncbi:MAG: restriction endonuclease subunit R, partial [Treponema sp.]|nr:restriction endonuclease subunit R [Treponema sp.]
MDDTDLFTLQKEIAELEQQLAAKKRQFEELQSAASTKAINVTIITELPTKNDINNQSPPETKIALFRSLFKGRDDIYAKRFENKKTGKSGYQPVCKNEWVQKICNKPKITCSKCSNRELEPITDEVIRNHLAGFIPAENEWKNPIPFVIGIYPLLQNEQCNFLAVDFDKETWKEDVKAFMDTCKLEKIP